MELWLCEVLVVMGECGELVLLGVVIVWYDLVLFLIMWYISLMVV